MHVKRCHEQHIPREEGVVEEEVEGTKEMKEFLYSAVGTAVRMKEKRGGLRESRVAALLLLSRAPGVLALVDLRGGILDVTAEVDLQDLL